MVENGDTLAWLNRLKSLVFGEPQQTSTQLVIAGIVSI